MKLGALFFSRALTRCCRH